MQKQLEEIHKIVMNMENYLSAASSTTLKLVLNKYMKKRNEISTEDKKIAKELIPWQDFLQFLSSEIFLDIFIASDLYGNIIKDLRNISVLGVRFITIYLYKWLYINNFQFKGKMKLPSIFDVYVDVMIIYNTKLFIEPTLF